MPIAQIAALLRASYIGCPKNGIRASVDKGWRIAGPFLRGVP